MNNQSEDRVLGTVGIYLRGEYDSSVKYEYMNQVAYQGSSYTCIKEEGCTGIDPTNSDYWICSAKKGEKGEKGDTGDVGPIGPKPVNGTDYNTNAEREEFKNAVVADSKADLEKYITEKETQLDNYTKDKETELDDYVTDTVKPVIDTYVTDTTKKDIDAYEKEKEKVLDTYTDTKKTEIDNYVTNTSKPALDQYEKDKEAELETAKDTAINEYDAHAESVLTETEDLFNALNTEKASGTELYIENAKPCRVINAGINGMYKQETTTGANIMNLNVAQNSKVTVNEDGTVTINGTGGFHLSFESFTFKANIPYYIKWEIVSGTAIQTEDKIILVPGDSACARKDKFTSFSFAEDKTFRDLWIHAEAKFENAKIRIWISESQSDFEPYTGKISSPNPNYSQEIEQIENVKLMHDSSNLFNVTDYTILNLNRNGNAKITKTKDNFSFVTSAEDYCGIYITTAKMKEYIDNGKNDTTYNISLDVSATQNTNLRYGISNVKFITINTKKTRISFEGTLSKPFSLYSLSQQADTTVIVSDIKVTKNEDTEYTPYQNQAINIDLKGNKLCAVSDTIKDKLLIDKNGNVALQKNVSEVIFNGNEHWELAEKGFYNSSYFVGKKDKKIFEACCNYFLVDKSGKTWAGLNHCGFNNSGYFWIQEEHKLATTSGGFNEWLTTHNLEVYYALATPELIDLGQLAELPKTFDGINNIWAETNIGNTEIEIEYVQDVKKLLEKQVEQQNARLDNIEALLSTTETSALLLDNMQTDLESEVK